MADDKIEIELGVTIIVGEMGKGLVLETTLDLAVDLRTMRAGLSGDDVAIKSPKGEDLDTNAFGLRLVVTPNNERDLFVLSFAGGNPRIELAPDAKMEVIYSRLSTTGRGLVMKAESFGIGHGGLDLVATAEPKSQCA